MEIGDNGTLNYTYLEMCIQISKCYLLFFPTCHFDNHRNMQCYSNLLDLPFLVTCSDTFVLIYYRILEDYLLYCECCD